MQYINLYLVDENDKDIEKSDVNFADIIGKLLWKIPDFEKKYPWVSTIDPYGMTWLNGFQTPIVAKELERLSSESNEQEYKDTINRALDFFKKQTTHRYIKFAGD